MKIAVFLNEQGHTLPLGQPGFITLFTRDVTGWQRGESTPFALSWQQGLAEIRQQTLSMLATLHDCHHLVARDIHGALLAWLDGMGITMWKCSGDPMAFLDQMVRQIENAVTP